MFKVLDVSLTFSVPGGDRRNCWVVVCQGGINTQADTMNQKTFIPIHKQIAWNIMNAISCLNWIFQSKLNGYNNWASYFLTKLRPDTVVSMIVLNFVMFVNVLCIFGWPWAFAGFAFFDLIWSKSVLLISPLLHKFCKCCSVIAGSLSRILNIVWSLNICLNKLM